MSRPLYRLDAMPDAPFDGDVAVMIRFRADDARRLKRLADETERPVARLGRLLILRGLDEIERRPAGALR